MTSNIIKIRDADPGDISALTFLVNELGYKTTADEMALRFRDIHHHTDHRTFIATINDTVAGMLGAMKQFSYQQNGYYVRIIAFVTHPLFRQMGAGKKLIEAVEQWANELSANSVLVNCGNREERTKAHQFYKQAGFDIRSSGYVKKL